MIKKLADNEFELNKFLLDQIKDEKIKQRISQSLYWYIKKAIATKYLYYALTIVTIVAPTISAIVLNSTLPVDSSKLISTIVLGCSSVSAALLPLFNYHKKWVIYRNQAEDIKRILAKELAKDSIDEKELLASVEKSTLSTDKKWTDEHKKE